MVEPPKALPSDVAVGTPHASFLQSFEELIDLKGCVFLSPLLGGTGQGTGDFRSECSAGKFVRHRLDLSRRDLVLLRLLEMLQLFGQFNDGSHNDFIVNLDSFVDIWMLLSCLMHLAKYFDCSFHVVFL